jgi:hypothetical protein
MPREALDFLTETTRRFGAPVEPLTLRDNQIGDHATIEKPKFDNSGLLFRNDNKVNDREPDYRGSLTIAGVEYRLSAWIKQGKESKFMSLAVTPKQVSATATKARAEFNDEIGF